MLILGLSDILIFFLKIKIRKMSFFTWVKVEFGVWDEESDCLT